MEAIEQLRDIVKRAGTQRAAADRLGADAVTVNRWLKGRSTPSRLWQREIKRESMRRRPCDIAT